MLGVLRDRCNEMTRIGSLFTGYGGLDTAAQAVFGGTLAWVSDIDPGACKILAHHHPDIPNLGDIKRVDWDAVEPVDIITGGFPCQDVSTAGRRAGMKPGTRSGLWSAMCAAVDHLRPPLVVIENVRGLLSADGHADVEPCPWCLGDTDSEPALRALGGVLGDLADIGFDAAWHGLTAASVGAPHGRFRVFIIAWPASGRSDGQRWPDAITRSARQWGSSEEPERFAEIAPDPRGETEGFWTGLRQGDSSRVRWGRPDNDTAQTDADTGRAGLEEWQRIGSDARQELPTAERGRAAPDTNRDGLEGIRGQHGIQRHPHRRSDPNGNGHSHESATQWGQFEHAIRRWESILGRPAPAPTETTRRGGQRLSPRFVEWMMGLPDGHVTGVPRLTRNEQLKALGNGVVPQQAEAAIRYLISACAVAA